MPHTSNEGSKSDGLSGKKQTCLSQDPGLTSITRTHRERKEAYIKQLENEVLQLRTNEAKITSESRDLQNQIACFKKILDHHGIPHDHPSGYITPPGTAGHSSSDSMSSLSIFLNPQLGHQQLHFANPQQGGRSDFYLCESDGSTASHSAESQKAPRKKLSFFRSKDRSQSGSVTESTGTLPTYANPESVPTAVLTSITRSSNIQSRYFYPLGSHLESLPPRYRPDQPGHGIRPQPRSALPPPHARRRRPTRAACSHRPRPKRHRAPALPVAHATSPNDQLF